MPDQIEKKRAPCRRIADYVSILCDREFGDRIRIEYDGCQIVDNNESGALRIIYMTGVRGGHRFPLRLKFRESVFVAGISPTRFASVIEDGYDLVIRSLLLGIVRSEPDA